MKNNYETRPPLVAYGRPVAVGFVRAAKGGGSGGRGYSLRTQQVAIERTADALGLRLAEVRGGGHE